MAALTLAAAGTLAVVVGPLNSASAAVTTTTIQAESYAAQSGAQLENTADTGGGQNVGWLANGDWMRYQNVNLGLTGSVTATLRLASASNAGGTVELRADSLTGPLLATWPVASTGGWQTWTTKSASSMTMLTGAHTVFLALRSSQAADFVNLNWFTIAADDMTTMPPMPTSTPGAWVSVDPVKQAADTKAFFALTPKPITNNPVRVPEFHALCTVSHHLNDDPIVFPNQPGASHNHTFLGNLTTDANSTLASLKAGGTNCDPIEDKSSYWVPTLYANGKAVDPVGGVIVYYGSRLQDPSRTQPFPEGFRMIAGSAKQQTDTPDHQGNHFWCAGIGGEVGRTADGVMPICAPTAQLTYQLVFPDCWDGVHLDSPDHKAHVSNVAAGGCPAAFPVPIPNLSFVISYPKGMDTTNVTLASGTTYSMHGDFFNAWEPAAQAQRVRTCLDQSAKCNAAGGF
ncbi:DUF1996 domain-containing protein [Cellulomonas sp. URHD0024]|uniref:DUF1996 domain-containing protein n=1 Tax=Cellulomonas sp. URHD0024 TaxID=1302620 RepID=UPI00042A3147|nr:DUF1996 domain-containing protein [Cellulomonas sp. URHD0024]